LFYLTALRNLFSINLTLNAVYFLLEQKCNPVRCCC